MGAHSAICGLELIISLRYKKKTIKESNPQPLNLKSRTLTTRPLGHVLQHELILPYVCDWSLFKDLKKSSNWGFEPLTKESENKFSDHYTISPTLEAGANSDSNSICCLWLIICLKVSKKDWNQTSGSHLLLYSCPLKRCKNKRFSNFIFFIF